jgi:signal transduction histidine kinase
MTASLKRFWLLLAALVGAAAVLGAWVLGNELAQRDATARMVAAEAQLLTAVRAARDNVPRSLATADRALSHAQARATAVARNDRREAEAQEQALQNLLRRGGDAPRVVGQTDAQGQVVWMSQPGAGPAWVGNTEYFLLHRYGRVAPVIGRYPVPALGGQVVPVLTYPILGPQGGFAGIVFAGLDPARLSQALPAVNGFDEPQIGLFLTDGTPLARGRNARLAQRLEAEWLPELAPGGGGERVVRGATQPGVVLATARVPGLELAIAGELTVPPGPLLSVPHAVQAGAALLGLGFAVALVLTWRRLPRIGQAAREAKRATDLARPPAEAARPAPEAPAPRPRAAAVAPEQVIEALPGVAYAVRLSPGQAQVTAVSPAIRRLTGWEPALFQDVSEWRDRMDWASHSLPMHAWDTLLASPAPGTEAEAEYRLRRPDGSWMWLRESARVIAVHGQALEVLGCLADVTRERDLAAQASGATRVVARGAMAAGLAHELNQPLAVMSLAAENALEALEEGEAGIPEALLRLRRIAAQAERAKAIAAQLRAFARLEAAVLEPVSLLQAVRGMEAMVGPALEEGGIELDCRLPDDLPAVRGQPLLVEQVLVNLCMNARDALLTRPEGYRRIWIFGEDGPEPDEVTLRIRDSGTGIPVDVIERIFDPFFTTKPATKGTGLGLPLCRSIMMRFGGAISVENAEGGGVEAVLTFRRARQGERRTAPKEPVPAE